jgi:hypothetical protein
MDAYMSVIPIAAAAIMRGTLIMSGRIMGGYRIHLLSLISGDLSLQGIAAVSMHFPGG